MKFLTACLAAGLLFSAAVAAQNLQPIKLAPIAHSNVEAIQVDQCAVDKAALARENKRLQEENAALKKRVDDFTLLGGSEVHAYCPSRTVSRNTAGGENDCALSGYACDSVSGQCRTRCEVSEHCATGNLCENNQCVPSDSHAEK